MEKMTLPEINAEIKNLDDSIATAAAELKTIEGANDTSAKGLSEHSKASSRLRLLTARKALLEEARPLAEYENKKQALDAAKVAWDECRSAFSDACEDARAELAPILGDKIPREVIEIALKVRPKYLDMNKAHGVWRNLQLGFTNWALANGFRP